MIPEVSTCESTLEVFTVADKSMNFSKTDEISSSFQVSCERVSLPHFCMKAFRLPSAKHY